MLRDPVAMVSPPLRVLRQIERIAKRHGCAAALANRGKIENGMDYLSHRQRAYTIFRGWGSLAPERFPFEEADANPSLFLEAPESWGHVRFLDLSHQPYDAVLLDVDNGPTSMVQAGNARLYSRRALG